ncbi:MAG: FprA family A-type flavoprotein [Candidatus Goldiibacteriota bacterium]|jgi:flavorubredoxin
MPGKKLAENVFYAGAKHWDRKFFDELIPLPDGTTYNSYIVKGSLKTALIDTVDPAVREQLFDNLKKAGVTKLDYIVANHAEQDHSGSIPFVLEKFPGAKVVTNEKCAAMLREFLLVKESDLIIIKDGDTLELDGKTLEFCFTPWVHWPETMCTYLREDSILFSCDFFGSHVAAADLFAAEHFYKQAKRYYAEIMSPFRNNVRTNLDKLGKFKIAMIAPSHGYIHIKPEGILNAYKEWSSENVKNEVVLAYVSMHESVKKMAEYLRESLIDRGIDVHFFNLQGADIGEIAIQLVDAATLIVGAPTVLAGLHPVAMNAVYIANALRPKTKFVSLISSFSWGDKATDAVKAALTNFKAELLAPVVSKGFPKENDLKELDRLADDIEKKHRETGVLK